MKWRPPCATLPMQSNGEVGQRGQRRMRSWASCTPVDAPLPTLQSSQALRSAHRATWSSYLDDNLPVLHRGRVGLHRDHARRHHHLAGADVELAIVEVALDHVALDVTLGQRARPMGALVIKDIELALDVKDRHRQSVFLNLEGGAGSDVIGIAEFDLRRHGSS